MAEYWRYAVSRTPSMFTSQSQAKMSISCDRRPIAICPRVTQSKDEQEENKRKLCVSVCPQGDLTGTEEWNAYLWKALAFR
jgi:NAD-dependent dihydropyrimidine dehydrogenase PreA subunit